VKDYPDPFQSIINVESGATQIHLHAPPVQSVLHLTNDVIRIESPGPVPNVWVRFWHRVLLGWWWEGV